MFFFTKEVIENPVTYGSIDFHEVRQTIEILVSWDPVRRVWILCLGTGIIQTKKRALSTTVDYMLFE